MTRVGALDALASLGLKAVPRNISIRFLVIDHAERNPIEN